MVLAGELLPPGISLDKSTQVPIFVQLFLSNQTEKSHNKGTGFGTKTRLKVVTPILACRQDREPQNGHNVPPASLESKKDSGSVC